jgi:hypothetical protein
LLGRASRQFIKVTTTTMAVKPTVPLHMSNTSSQSET